MSTTNQGTNMHTAHKITAALGAIGFMVSRIETVREQLWMSGNELRHLAETHEFVLGEVLGKLDECMQALGDHMNAADITDEDDERIVGPVFYLLDPEE